MSLVAVDCIAAYVPNIPVDSPSIQMVSGYATQVGTSVQIEWSPADFARFPDYIVNQIAQLPTGNPLTAGIIDYEPDAATLAEVVRWTGAKVAGKQIAVIYCDIAEAPNVVPSLEAAGIPLANVYFWLANWNLSSAEAENLLGTVQYGLTVIMVQWASPSSNPRTYLPGTNYQLQDAGCDLSVATTFPSWQEQSSPPAPPAPSGNWTETLVGELPEIAAGSTDVPNVERIQSLLIILGYNMGTTGPAHNGVDGDFGPITEAAVQHLQAVAHASNSAISVDGIVGPQTWPLLLGV